jgi:hypothetical protein
MVRSAALGGVFLGVLSALPFVSAGNCCCCLWIVSGRARWRPYLEVQQKNRTLTDGEGAAVGALAGVIGAFVWLPIAIVLSLALGPMQRAIFEGVRPQRQRHAGPKRASSSRTWAAAAAWPPTWCSSSRSSSSARSSPAIGGVLSAVYFKKEVPPALGGDWVPPLPPQ